MRWGAGRDGLATTARPLAAPALSFTPHSAPTPPLPRLPPPPAPQSLAVGMKLWGMVLEVSPRGLVVSLPQGLRGSVAPEEVRRRGAARARMEGGGRWWGGRAWAEAQPRAAAARVVQALRPRRA